VVNGYNCQHRTSWIVLITVRLTRIDLDIGLPGMMVAMEATLSIHMNGLKQQVSCLRQTILTLDNSLDLMVDVNTMTLRLWLESVIMASLLQIVTPLLHSWSSIHSRLDLHAVMTYSTSMDRVHLHMTQLRCVVAMVMLSPLWVMNHALVIVKITPRQRQLGCIVILQVSQLEHQAAVTTSIDAMIDIAAGMRLRPLHTPTVELSFYRTNGEQTGLMVACIEFLLVRILMDGVTCRMRYTMPSLILVIQLPDLDGKKSFNH